MSRNIQKVIAVSRLTSSPPPFRKWQPYPNAYGSRLAHKQDLNQVRGIASLLARQQSATDLNPIRSTERITNRQSLLDLHRSRVVDANRWVSSEAEQNHDQQDGDDESEPAPMQSGEGLQEFTPRHVRKVAIENLSAVTTWQILKDHLRTAGDVRSVRIFADLNGYSTGTAEAYFATEQDARAAMERLNGTLLQGKQIRVSSLANILEVGLKDRLERRVFLGNLPLSANWADVKDHLRSAGRVIYVRMLKTVQGQPNGCAVAEFAEPEEAKLAIEVLNGTLLLDRAIRVSRDRSPEERMAGRRASQGQGQDQDQDQDQRRYQRRLEKAKNQVFVVGFPSRIDEETLIEHMSAAGPVVSAKIFTDSEGRSKGYGIVEYESPEIVQKAVAVLHSSELYGRSIRVAPDEGPRKMDQERDSDYRFQC